MSLPPEDHAAGYGTTAGAAATPDPLSTTTYSPPAATSGGSDAPAEESTSAKDKAIETRDEVKDRASDVKDSAVDAGTHVAEVAKDQVNTVAAEAGQHAKDLLSQTRTELTSQVGDQQQRLAGGLRSLSDELHSMAQGNDQSGVASDLVRQAGDRSRSIASWLESREPGDVVADVTAFARRRPGTFIALAGAAGLLVGRFARSLRDDSMPDDGPTQTPVITSHADLAQDRDIYAEPVPFGDTAPPAAGTTATSALR